MTEEGNTPSLEERALAAAQKFALRDLQASQTLTRVFASRTGDDLIRYLTDQYRLLSAEDPREDQTKDPEKGLLPYGKNMKAAYEAALTVLGIEAESVLKPKSQAGSQKSFSVEALKRKLRHELSKYC